jgi:hypothetical protein
MNIFYLSHKPSRCARWHCDKHVVKMILDTTQLLYTAHWVLSVTPDFTTAPYRMNTHERGYLSIKNKKHPCAIWVRQSLDNYVWLCQLGIALCQEYRHRYGAKKEHSCEKHIMWLYEFPPPELEPTGWTLPPMAMPEEYRNKNPLIAYRAYYRVGKKHILTYTKRNQPHWLSRHVTS